MFELLVSEVSVLPGGEGGGRAPPIMMAKKRRVKIACAYNQPSPSFPCCLRGAPANGISCPHAEQALTHLVCPEIAL